MTNATDLQAAAELIASNPTMLWHRTTHRMSGLQFASRFNGHAFEVVLVVRDASKFALSVWSVENFEARFERGEALDAGLSAALDAKMFRSMATLDVVEVG